MTMTQIGGNKREQKRITRCSITESNLICFKEYKVQAQQHARLHQAKQTE